MKSVQSVLCFLVLLFVLHGLPASVSADEAWDVALVKRMFSRINLDYPGLEKVKAAWEKGKPEAAESAYLDFWRKRDDHVILWDALYHNADRRHRTWSCSDFFTDPCPVTISWRDREKLKERIKIDDIWANDRHPCKWTCLEMADMLLENKLTLIRMSARAAGKAWFLEPTDMGEKWDWNFIALDNPYTNGYLHRCYWMPVLTQVYWVTGEEKYAKKLIELWVDWVRSPPMGYGGDTGKNGGLGPTYQACLQPGCLEMILQSPHLKPRDFCLMASYLTTGAPLNSLLGGPKGGNQGAAQGLGIMAVAGAFPEFKSHDHWLRKIEQNMAAVCDGWVYPDGGFAETTFSYSSGTALVLLSWVENAEALAQKGMIVKMSGKAKHPENWGDYFMYSARPDWYLPWTGDGGRVTATKLMECLATLYPERKDFLYAATQGREGEAPKAASRFFDWAGYTTMRDRFSPVANYLFFDVGPGGAGHRDANKLMVIVASHGRTLLEDRGCHTYTPEKPEFLPHFSGSYSHSTVIVDGKTASHAGSEMARAKLDCPWTSNATIDYNAGDYRRGYYRARHRPRPADPDYSYTQYLGDTLDDGVWHHRSVVFVKPDYWIVTDRMTLNAPDKKNQPRTFEQLFQYIPCKMTKNDQTLSVTSSTPDEPNLALIPLNQAGLELEIAEGRREPYILGWRASGGDELVEPAPTVIYRKQAAMPAMMQTILWPNDKGNTSLPRVEPIADAPEGSVKVTLPDGRQDLYYSNRDATQFTLGDKKFNARAALVRLDADGTITAEADVK